MPVTVHQARFVRPFPDLKTTWVMFGLPKNLELPIEDLVVDFMVEKQVTIGVASSSMGPARASPSTSRRSPRQSEKCSKNQNDWATAQEIPSILPPYTPPLSGKIDCDIVSSSYDYVVFTTCIPKGVTISGAQLAFVPLLKYCNFNLEDKRNYALCALHRYLMLSSGWKPHLVPQPWTQQLDRSSILNVMKIPHFGRHQEVNVCVKLLLSSYHGGYFWLDHMIVIDTDLIARITGLSMKGPNPQQYYPGKTADKALAKRI